MLLFFSHNIDFALGWMVIHSLWQATLIAVVSGIVLISMRKKSPQLHYTITNIALFSVLGAALFTFFYYYNLAQNPGQLSFVPETSLSVNSLSVNPLIPNSENASTSQPINGLTINEFKTYFNRNLPLIVSIWLLGVTIFLLRLLGGITYIQYLRRRMNFPPDEYWAELKDKILQKAGVNRTVELVESAMVRTPMVIGHLTPMILFPIGVMNRLAPEEVEAILSHEIAHILRNDYIVNIAQSIVEALFYFHPAVWWLSSQVRNARESCCDDIAIKLCGNSMNYAKALVVVQDMNFYPLSPSLAFAGQQKNQLLMRVQRILHPSQSKSNIMEKTIALSVVLAVILSLSFTNNKKENGQWTMDNGLSSSFVNSPLSIVKLDSLPTNTENGTYNFSDNTQDIQMKVENNKPVALTINGVEIPEKDLSKFDALANKIVNRSGIPPIPPVPPTAPDMDFVMPVPPTPPMPPTPPIASSDNNFNINLGDDDGHFVMRTNKDGSFSMSARDKKDNSNFTMSAGKNGFTMQSNDGKSNIFQQNGDMIITGDDGEKVTIKSKKGSGNSTVITEKGDERTEIESDKAGGTKIRNFVNNKLVDELEVKGNKVFLNGKEATDEELRQRGYERCQHCGSNNGVGVNKTGGFNNIQLGKKKNFNLDLQNDIQMNINENIQESMHDMRDNLNESFKDLNESFKDFDGAKSSWKNNFSKQMNEFNERMKSFKSDNFNSHINEQLQARMAELKGRLEGLHVQLDQEKQRLEQEKENLDSRDRTYNDANHANTETMAQQFIADGLIKNPKRYSFSWKENNLIIDGKKISPDMEKKYAEMFNIQGTGFGFSISRHD